MVALCRDSKSLRSGAQLQVEPSMRVIIWLTIKNEYQYLCAAGELGRGRIRFAHLGEVLRAGDQRGTHTREGR